MDLVIISREDFFKDETALVNELFERGLMRFHLRKPHASAIEIKSFLNKIAPQYKSAIALHSHHYLSDELGIFRLHLPTKYRNYLSDVDIENFIERGYKLSTSCHTIEEINDLKNAYDYSFLSPVFDSISKAGYRGFSTPDFKLSSGNYNAKIYALGGINPENIARIKDMNFDGAAVLGTIWKDPKQAILNFLKLRDLCQ
jgi:thiamine-phosphate pyrophosphorylase